MVVAFACILLFWILILKLEYQISAIYGSKIVVTLNLIKGFLCAEGDISMYI